MSNRPHPRATMLPSQRHPSYPCVSFSPILPQIFACLLHGSPGAQLRRRASQAGRTPGRRASMHRSGGSGSFERVCNTAGAQRAIWAWRKAELCAGSRPSQRCKGAVGDVRTMRCCATDRPHVSGWLRPGWNFAAFLEYYWGLLLALRRRRRRWRERFEF